MTPQHALDELDEALRRLANATGGAGDTPRDAYLMAVPDVELRLSNAFEKSWVLDTLHTRRFWYLAEGPTGRNANINAA